MTLDWNQLLSTDRQRAGEPLAAEDEGHDFLSDYYRVVFSSSFRRLQDKTQVTPLATHDYVRRRLTHSVEVATVGERLARVIAGRTPDLGKDQAFDAGKIVATACLLHDIGNPPFGHKGEAAIAKWVADYIQREATPEDASLPDVLGDLALFDGNPQGFRLATRLSHHGKDYGLNLTAATLASTVKYPFHWDDATRPVKKFACMADDKPAFDWAWGKCGLPYGVRHPLTLIVEAADDIVNRLVDIEDGLKLGYLDFSDFCDCLSEAGDPGKELLDVLKAELESLKSRFTRTEARQLVYQRFRATCTARWSQAAETSFAANYSTIMAGSVGAKFSLIEASEAGATYKAIKKLEYDTIFGQSNIVRAETGGAEAIRWLLTKCVDAIQSEGDFAKTIPASLRFSGEPHTPAPRAAIQRAIDYVSGMTDSYAITLFRQLSGVSL